MKTRPTSIRFIPERLDFVKEQEGLSTPQKVVDFLLEEYWWRHNGKSDGAKTESKESASDKNEPIEVPGEKTPNEPKIKANKKIALPGANEEKHPLWKPGDPPEGSNGFYLRYGCSTYDELKTTKK